MLVFIMKIFIKKNTKRDFLISKANPMAINLRVSNNIKIINKEHDFFILQENTKILNKGK